MHIDVRVKHLNPRQGITTVFADESCNKLMIVSV